ncbi:MAG: DUF5979 domain-containing protein [Clostridiales bacterium]|nr:DUF5979 domain-containing protein [Clostridiales bacterium]
MKRFISAVVCVSMIGSSVANPAMMAYADSDDDIQEFELESEAIGQAITEAIADGSTVSAEELDFSGAEAEAYEELFGEDGLVYELKPEIDETKDDDGALDLRVFVRLDVVDLLDEDETLESYELTGDEDVFFMLVNGTGEEQNAVILVDGRETDVITVVPEAEVDGVEESDEIIIPAAGGSGGASGSADDVDKEAEIELIDDVTVTVEEDEDDENGSDDTGLTESEDKENASQDAERTESEGEDTEVETVDSVTADTKADDSDGEFKESEDDAADDEKKDDASDSDTSDDADTDENSDDTDAEDEETADDKAVESDQNSDDDADSESDDEDAEDTGYDSDAEDSSDDNTNDESESDTDSDSDDQDDETETASISIHKYSLVTLTASDSDMEESEETASPADATEKKRDGQLDGECYDAVIMKDGSAVVFATTTDELGLEDVISSGKDTVYTVESETAVITAVVPDGAFDEEVYLYAEEITEGSETWQQVEEIWEERSAQEGVAGKNSTFVAYDICFKNAAEEELEPDANIQISIRFADSSVLTGYDETSDNLSLLHISDDGEVEEIEVSTTANDADGVEAIEYEASSFSVYTARITSSASAEIYGTEYETVTAALAAVTDSTETTITMIADSKENITISSSQNIILDLNGYTLTGTGSGSVVTNNGTLTIRDSSGDDSGTITGGSATNRSGVTQGGGVYSSGDLTLAGGTISGNTARNGGGIYVTSDGSFTMTGGSVSGNTAEWLYKDTVYVASNGGGVHTSCATTITGGTIANNMASMYGGGFYTNTSEIIINGSDSDPVTITGNAAGYSGAGVYLAGGVASIANVNITENNLTGIKTTTYFAAGLSINSVSATLSLNNVTISGNSSSSAVAGGLGISAKEFRATNCLIENNTSKSGAGGICIYVAGNDKEKEYSLSNCQISGNTGGTAGALSVEKASSTKYSYYGVKLKDTVITDNTGEAVGGVSGAINMTGGAIYGNTSTDDNAAHDWLISKTVITDSSLTPAVYVPAASRMNADGASFEDYLWIDSKNALTLTSELSSATLAGETASTFYFTADELIYVAEITVNEVTEQYETIAAAIDAAVEMGGSVTIKLIADEKSGYNITEDVTIPANSSITINMNGCTISKKSNEYAVTISSGASLILTGSGTVAGIDDSQGGSLSILGDIEVGTVKLAADAVITASGDFAPESLSIVLADAVLKQLNDISDTSDTVTLVTPYDGSTLSEALAAAITISGANVMVSVLKDDEGNVIASVSALRGIFVDGVNGNDETGDGTYSGPVKTFAKAKELLKAALEANESVDGIYVINTITITDTEEWSLDGLTETAGEVSLMRLPTFTGILVRVGDGGNLTLSDITIDGKNYTVNAPLIQVYGSEAQLTINKGTVIQNNKNASNSNLTETEATIAVVNGTLTMNEGTITNNTGYWGGGIALAANDNDKKTVMYLNGGTISNNTADIGGGIFLYGNSTMYMNGGTIDSNTAYSRGGGLSVWSGADAYVYAGTISNNEQTRDSASNETYYGGGGIYVNDGEGGSGFGYGTLHLYNVEITDNSHEHSGSTFNGYYDGTIAACNTSNVEIYVTDGAVIYDNHANYGNDITLYNDVYQENFTLSPVMLGGGAYNWVDRNGNAVDVTDLMQYRGVTNGLAFKSTATEITGLDRVTTHIESNSAICTGAAIGVNGNLIIGRDDGTVTLNITKDWSDEFEKSSLPEFIDVKLYATDSKGVTADLGELTLSEENDWTVTVTDLPKYDSYYDSETQTSGTYKYTVGELSDDYFSIVYNEEVDDEDNDNQTAQYDITISNLPKAKLNLQKVVEGETSAENFEFEIELKYNGKAFDGYASASNASAAGKQKEYDLAFTDGKATVTLKADETLTLTLGAGMTYTVTETDSQGASEVNVDVNGVEEETASTSGTLTTDGVSIVVTNVYTGDEPTPEPTPGEDTGDLTVSKTVEGTGADTTKAFTFTVTLDDTDINGTYGDMTFVNGVATFTLTHGQSKTAEDLPENVGYEVTEEAADHYTSSSENETGTIESDVIKNVVFTNTYTSDGGEEPETGTGTLTVTKTVTGSGSKTKEFTFTVTLSDTSINGTYGDMTFVNGVATFTLTHGESKTAEGLPEGISYTVAESSTSGYRTTSDGATGTIVSGGVATVAFTNSRTSSGGGSGSGGSGSSTSVTTSGSTSGPGVSSGDSGTSDLGDSGTSDPGSTASSSDAEPLTALPKMGDDTSDTAMFTLLFGMAAVACVILSDKKKETENKN